MDTKTLKNLLCSIANGSVKPEQAVKAISEDVSLERPGGVTLDLDRERRTGLGEVVFGPGKSRQQLLECVRGLYESGRPVLVTKLDQERGRFLKESFPAGEYNETAGLFCLGRRLALAEPWPAKAQVMIVSAGSSDLPVALEALGSGQFFGLDCALVCDAGIAGLHRLDPHLEALRLARAVVAVAGMDGALPGVIAGLTPAPVVAVPTSTGYGASFGGVAALLTMLNSCSPGVTVVNIDNGFGAAAFVTRLLGGSR